MKDVKNMVLSLSVLCITACLITSCSSKRKVAKDAISYTLSDISTNGETPNWVFEGTDSKWEKNKDYTYFIGEDDNKDKMLCQKGASANATEKVIEQISQEVNSKYAQSISNDNGNLDKKANYEIQHQIESKLGGIEHVTAYWEQRNYQKALGADKNEKVYYCYKVVKVANKTLKEIGNSVSDATIRANDKK